MAAVPKIALVDCNNFFCSCERVFNPALIGKPVVVLSNNDGCIISRSDEAKALGIPMGAPLHEQQGVIRRHGVRVFSGNFTLYGDMSARVMSILRDEMPTIEVYSIDEAFLRLPEKFTEADARALRAKVLRWTGLPVCIGFAPTKLLAKAANHHAKKNKAATGGVFDITGREDQILVEMDVEDLWGVGSRLAPRFKAMGIRTARDLQRADPAAVRRGFGVTGERLLRELNGIPCMELEEMPPDRKGFLASRSFGRPVTDLEELEEALANHVAHAAERLRRHGLLANRITVFLRTNRFHRADSQYCPEAGMRLARPTASTSELMAAANELLRRIYRTGYQYKKTGVMLGELVNEEEYQPGLFDKPDTGAEVDRIVDQINRRMGDPNNPVITRASQGLGRTERNWRMKAGHRSPNYTTSWRELPVASA